MASLVKGHSVIQHTTIQPQNDLLHNTNWQLVPSLCIHHKAAGRMAGSVNGK